MTKEEIKVLFIQHYAKMYRVARTILYDEQESKDVVSDIFERLLDGRIMLMPDTAERYLLTSVRNQCIKRMCHSEVKRQFAEDFTPETEYGDEDERLNEVVEFAKRNLTHQELRIFYLRFTDGCSYEEIATQEGISKVAVWKHLSHMLNIIRKNFNSSGK
jgi:RNA polymerase sigma factor, sigma-70 family